MKDKDTLAASRQVGYNSMEYYSAIPSSISPTAEEEGFSRHQRFFDDASAGQGVGCLYSDNNYKVVALSALDGVSNAFICISVGYGLQLRYIYIFLIGVAVLMATSFYLLIHEFLASRSVRDYLMTEKRLAVIQFRNEKSDDISQMAKIFTRKGMPPKEADNVVQTLSQYNDLFVDIKIALNHGQIDSNDNDPNLVHESIIMQLSYFFSGLLILSIFLLPIITNISINSLYLASCGALFIAISIIASMKTTFSYNSWLSCFLESALTIAISAPVAYFISAEMLVLFDKFLS